MLHEYRDIITMMKEDGAANAHFLKIFDRHNELDQEIINAENNQIIKTDVEIDIMKKEKLRLKDEAYGLILAYKKEKNL